MGHQELTKTNKKTLLAHSGQKSMTNPPRKGRQSGQKPENLQHSSDQSVSKGNCGRFSDSGHSSAGCAGGRLLRQSTAQWYLFPGSVQYSNGRLFRILTGFPDFPGKYWKIWHRSSQNIYICYFSTVILPLQEIFWEGQGKKPNDKIFGFQNILALAIPEEIVKKQGQIR